MKYFLVFFVLFYGSYLVATADCPSPKDVVKSLKFGMTKIEYGAVLDFSGERFRVAYCIGEDALERTGISAPPSLDVTAAKTRKLDVIYCHYGEKDRFALGLIAETDFSDFESDVTRPFHRGVDALSLCMVFACPSGNDVVDALKKAKDEIILGRQVSVSHMQFRVGFLFGSEPHTRTRTLAPESLTVSVDKTPYRKICHCVYREPGSFAIGLVPARQFSEYWRDTADRSKVFYGTKPFKELTKLGLWP